MKHITRYTYDKNGNLLTETDALGNRVRYAHTPEGWLESITKADGNVLTFEYDKTGSLLTQHVGDGQTVESSYNEPVGSRRFQFEGTIDLPVLTGRDIWFP